MNAERLLALYEKVAEAPDAVPRLRRFVLDLAVRGKLVPHDTSEGQGAVLLKQIADAWKARLASGEIKKIVKWPKVSAEDVPFDVPSNWALVRLGEAMDLINGRAFKPSDWTQEGLPIVRIQNLNNASAPFNRFDGDVRPRFLIDTGDFLISWSGTPGTSFGAHIWDRGPAVLNQHIFKAVLLGEAFEKAFLKIAINSRLLELIEQAHGGVGLQHITKPKLEAVALTLPPLAEQRRIVAKVEELMALLDRLEAARGQREATRDRLTTASLARLTASDTGPDADPADFPANARFALATLPALTTRPDQIKPLRQTILNLAVRGKLAEQDPTDEPASELLKRIAAEKAASGKRQKDLPEIDADELGELPPNWSAVPLIALGEWAIGSGFPKNEQGETDGPYFFLKVSDMNLPENEKFITTANNTIDDEAAKRMRASIHPLGTIIFPKIGGAIATNKRRILTRGSAIDNNCLGITFASDIDVEWAYLLLTTLDFTRYQAGTAVPALQQGTLAAIPVALPPLAEQHRIVAKVDALMVLCDRLEAALTTTDTTRARLLEALLHEALDPAAEAVTEAAE